MYSWLKKYVDPIIPLFSIVPLLSCFALNMVVYSGTMILCDDWYHHDFTSSLDRAIPLMPSWIIIYFGCYLFWIVNYIMVARINRNNARAFYRFVQLLRGQPQGAHHLNDFQVLRLGFLRLQGFQLVLVLRDLLADLGNLLVNGGSIHFHIDFFLHHGISCMGIYAVHKTALHH